MRIGVVTAYSKPLGFNYGVLRFCQQAPDFGIDPILIAITRYGPENELVQAARKLGIHVETVNETFKYDIRVFYKFLKLVKIHNLDLLDLQTYKPLVFGLFTKLFRPRIKLVSWVHGFSKENLKIRIFGRVEIFLHRFSNQVVCVSDPFAQLLRKQAGLEKKIKIISNGIDQEEFSENPDSEKLRQSLNLSEKDILVGSIGRLSPEKGHALLVRAWPEIVKQCPEAKLLLVGDGVCMEELQKLTRELYIVNSVIFAGFRSDGRRFFSIFDFMVLPSLAEGLPYVLLEAMICKVPVIATMVGEVLPVTKNGQVATLIEPNDIEALEKAVTYSLKNKEIALEKAEKAFEFVLNNYSQKARTRQIVDLYKQIFR